MKKNEETITIIHDKNGKSLDWGWYVAFSVSTIGGFLLYPELMNIIYPESIIPGSLGAVFGFVIVFSLRIIQNHFDLKKGMKDNG